MSSTNVDYLKQVALIVSIIISVVTTVVSAASIKTDIEVIKHELMYVSNQIQENRKNNESSFSELTSQERRITSLEFIINNLKLND